MRDCLNAVQWPEALEGLTVNVSKPDFFYVPACIPVRIVCRGVLFELSGRLPQVPLRRICNAVFSSSQGKGTAWVYLYSTAVPRPGISSAG